MTASNNLQTAKEFIKAVESRAGAEDVIRFYHDEIVQTEFPNAVTNNTAVRAIVISLAKYFAFFKFENLGK